MKNKDKLVDLWEQTCRTTDKRLKDSAVYYNSMPSGCREGVEKYFYKDELEKLADGELSIEKGHKVSFNEKDNFFYLTYSDNPPIILRYLEATYYGSVKVISTTKNVKRGFWPFRWETTKNEYSLCEEDKKRIDDIYGKDCNGSFSMNTEGGRFWKTNKCALLQFGSLKTIISPKLREELVKCYFDAIERVDLQILEKRLEETK